MKDINKYDYFAGLAMQALIQKLGAYTGEDSLCEDEIAEMAYNYADAMIKMAPKTE